jgi:hypothetical protein
MSPGKLYVEQYANFVAAKAMKLKAARKAATIPA